MKLADLVDALELQVRAGRVRLEREVTGGYASDLLSDVIANGRPGDLWITLQRHVNTVAVASMKDLAAIVLVNGREPEEDTVQKAEAEEIPVLVSRLPTFELVGRLWELGVRKGELNGGYRIMYRFGASMVCCSQVSGSKRGGDLRSRGSAGSGDPRRTGFRVLVRNVAILAGGALCSAVLIVRKMYSLSP